MGASASPGPGTGPCNIGLDPSGQFEFLVKASDMPRKILLCENHQGAPATSSSFNTVQVYKALTNPKQKVNGQPTTVNATDFTLNLSTGAYDVVMMLNHLPSAQVAFVYESCGGLNQLARIPVLIQPSGFFSIKVV